MEEVEVKNNEERAEKRERGKENLFCPKQPHEGVFILQAAPPHSSVCVCLAALSSFDFFFAPERIIRRNYFACVAMNTARR